MNMAKTGYKLRTHISKSLQSRSQAIRTALERYNAAANAMKPRRQNLSWDQVVEYAFLADFDLLRDSRQDVRTRPWAQPGPRSIMHLACTSTSRLCAPVKKFNAFISKYVASSRIYKMSEHSCNTPRPPSLYHPHPTHLPLHTPRHPTLIPLRLPDPLPSQSLTTSDNMLDSVHFSSTSTSGD